MALLMARWCGAMLLAWLVLLPAAAGVAESARIKDIAAVEGIRSNQLSGYGIVVGLQGTGDGQQAVFTIQSILNMLRRRGVLVQVDPRQVRVKNAAAVLVTASLPPFARSGDRIDIQVSSLGDAKSLRGGTLISTPLLGGDDLVYAVAQGAVSLGGGFSVAASGSSETIGHPTAGTIPEGALVERQVPVDLGQDGRLLFSLHMPDVTTAARMAGTINRHISMPWVATALDPKTVEVRSVEPGPIPAMQLLAQIEKLEVATDRRARIVINERTGTIVMGSDIRLAPVAIAHGTLQIEIQTQFGVSQPAPFSEGETVVVPDSQIVAEGGHRNSLAVLKSGVTLGELVAGLNTLGVTPQDLIAVLQGIQASGALDGEIEMM